MILPASSLRRIRYGRLDASEEDLREAALITGLGPFLGRLEPDLTGLGEKPGCQFPKC